MGEDWQNKQFRLFMEDTHAIGPNEEKIKRSKFKGLAKKPGQRKRGVSERTS